MNKNYWIFIFLLNLYDITSGEWNRSCSHAPSVKNASQRIEEDGDIVIASYVCNSGFRLIGEERLYCDLNTNEWFGTPPVCEPSGGELFHVSSSEEINTSMKEDSTEHGLTDDELRARKLSRIKEDDSIPMEFAMSLDMSCHKKRIKAPKIDNGEVFKYDRFRKGEQIFLVAFYECDEDYELEDLNNWKLYCSNESWIGNIPECISIDADEDDDDYSSEHEDLEDDENDENIETENNENVVDKHENQDTDLENEVERKLLHESGENFNRDQENHVYTYFNNYTDNYGENNNNNDDENDEEESHLDPSKNTISENSSESKYDEDNEIEEDEISCGDHRNNGGCDHECSIEIDSASGKRRISCGCYQGFALDPYDRKTCHDTDECQPNNGDCNQICVNTLGSFYCSCYEGYELDVTTGKICIDVDECKETDIHHRCPFECENLPGSYKCLEEPSNSKEQENHYSTDNSSEMPESSYDVVRSGSQDDCRDGFKLNDDGDCVDVDECLENVTGCDHCLNKHGGFECICPEGYELGENGKNCKDINECEEYPSIDREDDDSATHALCSHSCENLPGTFRCVCPENFHLHTDLRTCVRDYCEDLQNTQYNKTKCSHVCEDENEGYVCHCFGGYKLDTDFKTCIKVETCNEDDERGNTCHPGTCLYNTTKELYECECPLGYEAKESRCHDVDECLRETHECSHFCHNTEGSYVCSCPVGLTFRGYDLKNCIDIDECKENSEIVCGDNMECENTIGSYRCVCPKGEELQSDGSCSHYDACQNNNGGCSHLCSSHNGFPECNCPDEMILSSDGRNCEPQNPCLHDNGNCTQICDSSSGELCSCYPGYELDEDKKTCLDINECEVNNGDCKQICENHPGSYRCTCEIGYKLGSDLHTCFDVNECELNIHDCSHLCINIPGGYDCACPDGLKLGYNKLTCYDVNECSDDLHPPNGGCSDICTNTYGSYACECPDGHNLSPDNRTCVEIDNCHFLNNRCSHECRNTKEGFECLCPPGYILDENRISCVDIDECSSNSVSSINGRCSHGCINTDGHYFCTCPFGFKLGEDGHTCEDIDECLVNNGGCSHFCGNFEGGYQCSCPEGNILSLDNKTCTDLDLCSVNNGGCEQVCEKRSFRVKCSCYPGYILDVNDNSTCLDYDECKTKNTCKHVCHNTLGSFKCGCHRGYKENGEGFCVDIDECSLKLDSCSNKAKCVNQPGSYRCICPPGYKILSDMRTCIGIQDRCEPLKPPENGNVHCTKVRHKMKLLYKMKCSVWCQKGYRLLGPSIRQCNESGNWDQYENSCVSSLTCPPLKRPDHGTILPIQCLLGSVHPGEKCLLNCPPGFVPDTKKAAICNADQTWSTNSTLKCIPISFSRNYDFGKPHIKCPKDTVLILPKGQNTVHVKLQQPKTNVDFYRNVVCHPDWAKHLEAHLGIGVHVITFKARSPETNLSAMCRTVITVKEPNPPTLIYCPNSFEVQLGINEESRQIDWKEPVFESHTPLKHIYKSNIPGERLGGGVHRIVYVATDQDGLISKCEFKIFVIGHSFPASRYTDRRIDDDQYQGHEIGELRNNDIYLICPGKLPVKVDFKYPLNVPIGCSVKSFHVSPFGQHLRRHQPIFNGNILRPWNEPILEKRSVYRKRILKSFGPMN